MTRKEAHQRQFIKSYLYNRNRLERWREDYTREQLDWLWQNKHIQWSAPKEHLGEFPNEKYIEFTPEGSWWFDWYSMPTWFWIKAKVFHWYDIIHWWHRIRIACGHHYDWQDYASLDEI